MPSLLHPSVPAERWLRTLVLSLLFCGALALVGCDSRGSEDPSEDGGGGTQTPPDPLSIQLSGNIQHVHDPVIVEENGFYYTFSTGGGIQMRYSQNLNNWTYGGDVLGGVPSWAQEAIEGVQDLWAPDVAYFNDQWHLYYSASTFGSGRSAIGLATAPALSTDGADWTDQQMVIESYDADPYNAIDANIAIDDSGQPWMAFGSYNDTGIRMRRIDPETGKLSEADEKLYQLAARPDNGNALEAPFIVNRDEYYYLFVSWDRCCAGVESTYNIRVGRSESVTGPYVDREGVPMNEGGGTLVVESGRRWIGPGHSAYLETNGEAYLVYHAYDANTAEGLPTLRISPVEWESGWPFVEGGVRPEE